MYSSTTGVKDKVELEKTLAEIEEEDFQLGGECEADAEICTVYQAGGFAKTEEDSRTSGSYFAWCEVESGEIFYDS